MADRPVGTAVGAPQSRSLGVARGPALGAFVLALALILLPVFAPRARATAGIGVGVLPVDGRYSTNLTALPGGTYYLVVATDAASAFVNASLAFNGSVLAQENATIRGATFASLPAGNYSLSLAGRGRAALAWDFTNGAQQSFSAGEPLVAFLNPSGPRVQLSVSRGDASALDLSLFDDTLQPAGTATASSDGPVTFDLNPAHESAAILVVRPTAANPNGLYGLSWSSGPTSAPLDFTSWPLFLLWIVVPVGFAFVVFVLVQRRSRR